MIRTMTSSATPSSSSLRRWLAGGAALVGGAGSASAELVQIDLFDNTASVSGQNPIIDNTNPDLTGDGIADLTTSNALLFGGRIKGDYGLVGRIAGQFVLAVYRSSSTKNLPSSSGAPENRRRSGTFEVNAGSNSASSKNITSVKNFFPITFTDDRINGGAPTSGHIEVVARNLSSTDHEIQLLRLIFDDENTQGPLKSFLSSSAEYPQWADIIAESRPLKKPLSNVAKKRLKSQIAALEAQIKQIKATAKPNSPRLNFYRMSPATIQWIIKLERRLAAFKRALARL